MNYEDAQCHSSMNRPECDNMDMEDVHVSRSKSNIPTTEIDERTIVLPKVPPCKHCGAYKFYKESDLFCCLCGEIYLTESILPDSLVALITGTDEKSKDFQNMIRTYNNHFVFTTIGIHCDSTFERRDHGVYTVRVQGKVYHFLGDLLPQEGTKKLSGLQFYFFDPEHQAANRMELFPRLDGSVVELLVHILSSNPYEMFLKSVSCLEDIDNYQIIIRSNPVLDQEGYNKPTSSDVAAIWVDDDNGEGNNISRSDIRVYAKSGKSHNVCCYYGCYDPLQYVIMFPNGDSGWHINISRVGHPTTQRRSSHSMNNFQVANCSSFEHVLEREQQEPPRRAFEDIISDDNVAGSRIRNRRRTTVSCREYYVYKLQIRENDRSYILRFGRLLQQYIIDNYIKIESMRLEYFRQNQKKLRREHYQGIMDSVVGGIQKGGRVGTRVYLPATFIGGPRDMRHR